MSLVLESESIRWLGFVQGFLNKARLVDWYVSQAWRLAAQETSGERGGMRVSVINESFERGMPGSRDGVLPNARHPGAPADARVMTSCLTVS